MQKIITTSHIVVGAIDVAEFGPAVNNAIDKMQNDGLEVEVQYQQNNNLHSALIIGREVI